MYLHNNIIIIQFDNFYCKWKVINKFLYIISKIEFILIKIMIMTLNIESTIKNIIKDLLGVNNIKSNSSLIDDLGANNLDVMELIMTIEENFEVENLKTVQNIIDYIKLQLKNN